MKKFWLFSLAVILTALISLINVGCSEDNPEAPPVETEHPPATTVTMYLIRLDSTGVETTDTTTATVRDTSVVPGKPANEDTLMVNAGTSYKGTFKLIDESVNPPDDLTQDIIDEQDAHLYVFTISSSLNGKLTVTDLNKDHNGLDFGQIFKVNVNSGVAGSGFIHVQLQHHDSGDKTDNVYDLDLDRDFPVEISL
jgi:hypothetical protein